MPPALPALSELSIDTLLQPKHHAQQPPTHVPERGGPWDSIALDTTFYPSLQTTLLPMTETKVVTDTSNMRAREATIHAAGDTPRHSAWICDLTEEGIEPHPGPMRVCSKNLR